MNRGKKFGRLLLVLPGVAIGVVLWVAFGQHAQALEGGIASQELAASPDGTLVTGTFTPAHRSIGEAIRHYLGLRDTPEQPIQFSHQLHLQDVGLDCEFCHNNVSVSSEAGLPGVQTCMLCHSDVGQGLPEVDALVEYASMGMEPTWERVYGWDEEDHVLFKHEAHYNAGVGCQTCHGQVQDMTVAERAVEHSMNFCVDCHVQNQASIDCVACHY